MRGTITLDEQSCHVCTCSETTVYDDEGYPAYAAYEPTVSADRSIPPTEGGSWFYVCSKCGAGAWSGA